MHAMSSIQFSLAKETYPGSFSQDLFVSLPLVSVAVAVWLLERRARTGGQLFPLIANLASSARSLVPELVGLALCSTLAAVLVYHGEHNGAPIPKEDAELWKSINSDWPVLSTADTLIGLQALLRVLVLASTLLRSGTAKKQSLMGEPSVLFLAAAISRVMLLVLSPHDIYHLDGPLGGVVNVAFETAAVPLLVLCCRRMLGQGDVVLKISCAVMTVLAASALAVCHRLSLAEVGSEHLDVLFSLSKAIELFAAMAFLARTVALGGGSGGFSHVLLPLQQGLGVYFMVTAWNSAPFEEVPELVGAGHPFHVLQGFGLLEVGFYLVSLAIFAATRSSTKEDDSALAQSQAPLLLEV